MTACPGDPDSNTTPDRESTHVHGSDSTDATRLDVARDRRGETIGGFSIKAVIGTGGMGTVYEAMQSNPRRRVALKMMKKGITSKTAFRRFEFESQLLGRLHHPGIAQVYEAGTHDDGSGPVPYFAMEYISGARSLTDYAQSRNLGTQERLELFVRICDAVQHGHLKGIVHRDLKPSNILVDGNGRPKIIDFGVARSTDSDMAITTLQTDIGQLVGTLQYMSPEQCEADPHDIDARSDVYALGVIFYELLADALPYDLNTVALHEAVRIVREEEPSRLSTADRRLRGDLETIALKSLEKDRTRRYQSVTALADDIQRYLNDEPIAARPPSLLYAMVKWSRRHRATAAMIVVLCVLCPPVAVLGYAVLWSQEVNLQLQDSLRTTEQLHREERLAHLQAVVQRDRGVAAMAWSHPGEVLSRFGPADAPPILPTVLSEGVRDAAVVIPLRSMLSDSGSAAEGLLEEGISQAIDSLRRNYPQVGTIIFEVDSGGGLVVTSIRLAQLMDQYRDDFEFIAVVEHAVGAMLPVVLACDRIVAMPTSSFGIVTLRNKVDSDTELKFNEQMIRMLSYQLLDQHGYDVSSADVLARWLVDGGENLYVHAETGALSVRRPADSREWVLVADATVGGMLDGQGMLDVGLADAMIDNVHSTADLAQLFDSELPIYNYAPHYDAYLWSHIWTRSGRLHELLPRYVDAIHEVARVGRNRVNRWGDVPDDEYFTDLAGRLRFMNESISLVYRTGQRWTHMRDATEGDETVVPVGHMPAELACIVEAVETYGRQVDALGGVATGDPVRIEAAGNALERRLEECLGR